MRRLEVHPTESSKSSLGRISIIGQNGRYCRCRQVSQTENKKPGLNTALDDYEREIMQLQQYNMMQLQQQNTRSSHDARIEMDNAAAEAQKKKDSWMTAHKERITQGRMIPAPAERQLVRTFETVEMCDEGQKVPKNTRKDSAQSLVYAASTFSLSSSFFLSLSTSTARKTLHSTEKLTQPSQLYKTPYPLHRATSSHHHAPSNHNNLQPERPQHSPIPPHNRPQTSHSHSIPSASRTPTKHPKNSPSTISPPIIPPTPTLSAIPLQFSPRHSKIEIKIKPQIHHPATTLPPRTTPRPSNARAATPSARRARPSSTPGSRSRRHSYRRRGGRHGVAGCAESAAASFGFQRFRWPRSPECSLV